MSFTHSSVIVTAAATDTRTRDQLAFSFTARPQAMTTYIRFVEQGTVQKSGSVLLQIGSNGTTNPRIVIDCTGSFYRCFHLNSVGASVSATLAVNPTFGQTIEIRLVLNANGSVMLGQSIAGGAETTTATSSALVLPTLWASQHLMVNSAGTAGVGFNAFRNIEIAQGVRTMQQMRVVAGTD